MGLRRPQRRTDDRCVEHGKRQVVSVCEGSPAGHQVTRFNTDRLELPDVANAFEEAGHLARGQVHAENLVVDGFEMQRDHKMDF